MKYYILALALTGLTACASDTSSLSGPAPTPPSGPVVGLSCDLYDLSVLMPSVLPVFGTAPASGTVVSGAVYAGLPVASVVLTGALDYSTPAAMGSSLTTWYGLNCKAKITVKTSAMYSFKLTSDDGSKLIIDGYTLINNDGHHGATMKSGSILLTAGEHTVNIQYMEGTGPVTLKLESNLPVEFYH